MLAIVNDFDVIVIGAGASGLMCAMSAGLRGRSVLVLDRSNKVGKKILMSGGGRCNFTNLLIEPDCFISENSHFCKSALQRYTQWDFIALIEKHGIAYHERKHGQLFCDQSAKEVLKMLLDECARSAVDIRSHCEIKKVDKIKPISAEASRSSCFSVKTSLGNFSAESLVVATGGLSIPTMGSSGFGYELAQQFGLQLTPRRAGLVPFMFSDGIKRLCENLSGIALEVRLTLVGKKISFIENILFTHRGLSGPAVLQLSNYWQPGDTISIDLLPTIDLAEHLRAAKKSRPKTLIRTSIFDLLPKKLVQELEVLFWPEWKDRALAELSDDKLTEIAAAISHWKLKPSATEGYRTAEVTLGGVDTSELSSKTMESKRCPGLYFIGEVVDVSGHLGGFNFQWAWSSASAAGGYV